MAVNLAQFVTHLNQSKLSLLIQIVISIRINENKSDRIITSEIDRIFRFFSFEAYYIFKENFLIMRV